MDPENFEDSRQRPQDLCKCDWSKFMDIMKYRNYKAIIMYVTGQEKSFLSYVNLNSFSKHNCPS